MRCFLSAFISLICLLQLQGSISKAYPPFLQATVQVATPASPEEGTDTDELEGFNSDLLVIYPAISSVLPNSPINLFASTSVSQYDFLCEVRGLITPIEDVYQYQYHQQQQHQQPLWIDPNYILTSLGEQQYYLTPGPADISSSFCHLVHDCINLSLINEDYPTLSDYYHPGCHPNALLTHQHGKLYLVALENLQQETEIFVTRGLDYWRLMMKSLGYVTHPANIPIPQFESSVDLDYLNLVHYPSFLPGNIGGGIFARYDIPPDTILCEYRGPTYPFDAPIESDKWSSTLNVNNQLWKSMGVGFCSIINDPTHIKSYPKHELDLLYSPSNTTELPFHKGFTENVRRASNGPKSFVVSTKYIHAGGELFYSYRKGYWKNILYSMASN